MRQRLVAALSAAVLVGSLSACRKKEATVEIDRSGKNVTIRTADATVSTGGGSVALPPNFPKEIPMFPGARLAAAVEAGGDAGGGVVTIESSAWPDDIAKFYREKLPGWKTAMDMKTEDAHTLILRRPDGKLSLTIAATREALNTVASLTVSER